MVSAGARQPSEAPSSSSLPTLASTGSCARLRPAKSEEKTSCNPGLYIFDVCPLCKIRRCMCHSKKAVPTFHLIARHAAASRMVDAPTYALHEIH